MSKSPVATKEEIWNIIAETNRQIKALSAENKAFLAEKKASSLKVDKQIAEVDKQIAELSAENKTLSSQIAETKKGLQSAKELFETQWGRLMESLVEGDLTKILQEKGIKVINTIPNIQHNSETDQYEYDIIATNGKEIVVVEVKTTLRVKHIKHFLPSLKKVKTRLDFFKDKIVYGAVAYLRAEEDSAIYAEKQGLFVIRATGSSASIINKQNFKPKLFV